MCTRYNTPSINHWEHLHIQFAIQYSTSRVPIQPVRSSQVRGRATTVCSCGGVEITAKVRSAALISSKYGNRMYQLPVSVVQSSAATHLASAILSARRSKVAAGSQAVFDVSLGY